MVEKAGGVVDEFGSGRGEVDVSFGGVPKGIEGGDGVNGMGWDGTLPVFVTVVEIVESV